MDELRLAVTPVVQSALECVINTNEDFLEVSGRLKALAELKRKINAVFDPIVKAAHATHKEAVNQKKMFTDRVEEAERLYSQKWTAYKTLKESEARKAEQKAQRMLAEQEAKRKEEQSQRLAETGNVQAAFEELIREPEPVAVILPSAIPKVGGLSTRTNWTFEVMDEMLIPREYLIPDLQKIRKVVLAMRNACQIPGIRVFEQESLVRR